MYRSVLIFSKSVQDKMLAQLTLCEYSFAKSRQIAKTTAKEMKNYEEFTNIIAADIAKAKQDIEIQKEECEKSKLVRKNKMEYEVLAQTINENADRDQTCKYLDGISNELTAMQVSTLFIDIIVHVYSVSTYFYYGILLLI